jgi:putative transposase
MPRQARVVAVGAPHHITQRGNNRQDVFLSDEDRRVYLDLIREQSQACELALLGYCLMTNHVHLVAIPRREDSLAQALRRAHSQYSQWFNRRYRRSGHLWQSRYFSCSLDRDHLIAALLYVDLNPVRAALVGDAQLYPWTSAPAHVTGEDRWGLVDIQEWRQLRVRVEWSDALNRPLPESELTKLRLATRSGAPCGGVEFVRSLEEKAGRCLELRARGRPRKREMTVSATR